VGKHKRKVTSTPSSDITQEFLEFRDPGCFTNYRQLCSYHSLQTQLIVAMSSDILKLETTKTSGSSMTKNATHK